MLTKTITYIKEKSGTSYGGDMYTRVCAWRILGILIYRITEPCPPTVAF